MENAEKFVGTKIRLCKRGGSVEGVISLLLNNPNSTRTVQLDKAKQISSSIKEPCFEVRFEDGEVRCMLWDEIFGQQAEKNQIEVLECPEGAAVLVVEDLAEDIDRMQILETPSQAVGSGEGVSSSLKRKPLNDFDDGYQLKRQRVKKEMSVKGLDKIHNPGFNGQIFKVVLKNFMCHDHLEVELGPNVNIISGTNGSGKSAILQGIQACLGVSARQTGRGSSLMQFIQKGKESAVVQVSLWNCQELDAYRFEQFGRVITIERRISKSSGFAVYGENGVKWGSKREDVDRILDYFDINASNPAIVMTQDMSRSLLCSSDSQGKLYQLYMEVNQFDVTAERIQESNAQIQEIKARLEQHAASFQNQLLELQQLEHRLECLEEVDEWRQREIWLTQIIAWSQVYAQEQNIQAISDKLQNQAPVLSAKLEESRQEAVELIEQSRQLLNEKNQQSEPLQQQGDEIKNKIRVLNRDKNTIKANLKSPDMTTNHQRTLTNLARDRNTILKEQQDIQQNAQMNAQAALEIYQNQVQNLSNRKQETINQFEDAKLNYKEAEAAKTVKEGELKEIQDKIARKQQYWEQVRYEKTQLQKSLGNPINSFGSYAGQLVQLIQQNIGRFSLPPLGPIGSLLALSDVKYSTAIEHAVGRIFNNFIVHNKQDQNQLLQLASSIRNCTQYLTVIIYDYNIPEHNLRNYPQPHESLVTALSQITIKEGHFQHTIRNVIIDYANAERNVLALSSEEGFGIIRNQQLRQNVGFVFVSTGLRLSVKGSNESTVTMNKNIRPRLGANVADQIADCDRQQEQLNLEMQGLRQSFQQVKKEKDEKERMSKAAKKVQEKSRNFLREIDTQLTELETANTMSGNDDTARLVEIERELTSVQEQMKEAQNQHEEQLQQKEQLKQQFAEVENQIKQYGKEIQNVLDQLQGFDAEQKQLQNTYAQHENRLQQIDEDIKKLGNQIGKLQRQLEREQQDLAEIEAQASQFCNRQEAQQACEQLVQVWKNDGASEQDIQQLLMNVEQLNHNLRSLKAKIRGREQQQLRAGETLQSLKTRKMALEIVVKEKRQERDCIEKYKCELKKSWLVRRRKFRQIMDLTEKGVSKTFRDLLRKRRFVGCVRVDPKEESLELEVEIPNQVGENKQVKDLKSLSGGERSYTSVSFILALAQIVQAPFFALDEFDVFMDAVARRMALVNLLAFAKQYNNLQFIFLTPQDIAAVQNAVQSCSKDKDIGVLPEDFVRKIFLQSARPASSENN